MVKVPKTQNAVITHILGSKYKVIKWRGRRGRKGKSKKSHEVQEESYGYEEKGSKEEGEEGCEEGSQEGEEEDGEEEEIASREQAGPPALLVSRQDTEEGLLISVWEPFFLWQVQACFVSFPRRLGPWDGQRGDVS
jgi:hypothetical protein